MAWAGDCTDTELSRHGFGYELSQATNAPVSTHAGWMASVHISHRTAAGYLQDLQCLHWLAECDACRQGDCHGMPGTEVLLTGQPLLG